MRFGKSKSGDAGSVSFLEPMSENAKITTEEMINESYSHIYDFEKIEASFSTAAKEACQESESEKKEYLAFPGTSPSKNVKYPGQRNLNKIFGDPEPIKPKYQPLALRDCAETDPDVFASIDTYAVNIGGVNWSLEPIIKFEEKIETKDNGQKTVKRINIKTKEEIPDKIWQEMQAEKEKIESFIENICLKYTFRQLRMMSVRSTEEIGYSFWEVIRSPENEILGVDPVKDSATIRLCKEDKKPVVRKKKIRTGTSISERECEWTFRRYIQAKAEDSEYNHKFYKSFGDERYLDANTGIYYESAEYAPVNSKPATELIYFKSHAGIDYGFPRFVPNYTGIQTNKGAQITNKETMSNSGIPKIVWILRNFKDKTLELMIKKDHEQIKKSGSKNAAMVVRTPPSEIGIGPDAKQVENEIRIERLNNQQEKDGNYLNLQEFNSKRTQTCMRLPDMLLGKSDSNLNRATAFIMQANVEKQVFQPARQDFDDFMNKDFFTEMEFRYWKFLSQSIDLNDTELYIRILELYASYGGILPNDLRNLSPELLGIELGQLEESWANIPKHIAILQQKVINDNIQKIESDPNLNDEEKDSQKKSYLKDIFEQVYTEANPSVYNPPEHH